MKKTYTQSGQLTLESMSKASWYNSWTINFFKKYLKGDILEIGCGIGNFTEMITSYGNVYAFDVDKFCLETTRKKLKNKAKVGYGDIEKGKYFFKRKKFDVIVCINVLEHIKNDKKALSNMINLLKRDGILIILVPSHPSLFGKIDHAIGHYRRYIKEKITQDLKRSGMDVLLSRKINFLGALGWFFSGKIIKEVTVNEKKLRIFNKIAPIVLPLEEMIEPVIGTSIIIISQPKQLKS